MKFPTTKQSNEPIAIIGTGLRFPGGVNNSTQFWDLLQHPRDVRTSIPIDRFSTDGFYNPSHNDQGTSRTRYGYFLGGDHRRFDAEFFGIKPVEAMSMDPQQRLLLEVVYEGIEAAGLDMEALRGSLTAVYAGIMAVDYNDMLNRDTSDFPPYVAAGNARSIISNRVSHFFDWRGPSMTIDTACSSSLVAVHLAIQSLRSGDSTLAIATGANLMLGPETFIIGSDMKMLSPDGRSYWCDARANGYARGEGIAAVVLKPLSAAIADGDNIECVIVETGLNQDGRTQGLTVPSADAQAALIRSTYRKAGLDLSQPCDRPQYFEAHGTGTPIGDPIEVKAIHDAFFGHAETGGIADQLYCGSVKTLVGHTEGTAGLASLIKTSLALRHGVIPSSFLFENLAPNVKSFFDKLKIATKAETWPSVTPGAVRRASVNSFGFGGTNAHCILESYHDEAHGQITRSAPHLPYVFSAPSEKALLDLLRSYSAYFATAPEIDLRALSHTLCGRRTKFPARVAFAADSIEALCVKADSIIYGGESKPSLSTPTSVSKPQILGIFTGQGAQWTGMGSHLMRYPGAIAVISELERSLAELPDPPSWSLTAELSKEKLHSRVTETAIAQPACTAIQILLVDMLRAAGVHFSAVVGHSSGEIASAYAAGYLSARDAIRVAYYRGRHVHLIGGKHGERGSMIAIGASYEEAQNLCHRDEFYGRICIAASNSAASVTLSGDASAVEEVQAMFQASNRFARKLRVDNAYHSHHMIRCSDAITASYRECKINSQRPAVPNCLWVSSVYHQDIALVTDSLDGEYWHSNTVGEVLFSQALECALQKENFDLAVEIGAHPALKGPALQVMEDSINRSIPYTGTLNRGLEDDIAFANTLGYIWANLTKSDIDLVAFDRFLTASDPPMFLEGLPTYPWNHERAYWHESRISRTYRSRSTRHELLGLRSVDYSDDQISWKNHLVPEKMTWLQDHHIQGQMVFPGAAYIVSAFEAARQVAGDQSVTSIDLTDFEFDQPLVFVGEDCRMEVLTSIHGIRRDKSKIVANFTYHSIAREASGPMILNAHCQLTIYYSDPGTVIFYPSEEKHFGMRGIDSDRIYKHLAKHGYQYTGPFQSLTSVSRRLGVVSGLITLPPQPDSRLTMHPATLDAAMHSIMVARSYPGDGQLTIPRVPTGISKISLNLSAAMEVSSQRHLRVLSRNVDDGQGVDGEVKLSLEDSPETILQLEGLRTKPVRHATPADDICMFSMTTWSLACPLTRGLTDHIITSEDSVQMMASITELLTHRYPGMHILGVGEASSNDMERFLLQFDGSFASYTYTNATEEELGLSQNVLDSVGNKIVHKALCPEINVADQGFATHSYDMVVAFSMPSKDLDFRQMLNAVRSLLKPGAYFLYPHCGDLFLPGSTSRTQSATPTFVRCEKSGSPSAIFSQRSQALERFGFADIDPPSQNSGTGLDSVHGGVALIQAIDDRVCFLRDPLNSSLHHLPDLNQSITLVGGEIVPTSICASRIAEIVQPFIGHVSRASSIPSLTETEIGISNSVIVLQDHDKPLFDCFNETVLTGLKRLFGNSRNILWVTHGYKANAPHARMFVAFARCLVQEMAHVRLQILDFESPDVLDAEVIAKEFLRLQAIAGWEEHGKLENLLWSVEPETAYEKGCGFVPRIKPSKMLNNRYNSASRTILRNVIANDGSTTQVRVKPIDHERLFRDDRTYWLVGLTGDLGLSLCEWMGRKGTKHIALSSRQPKVDPAWLAHLRSSGTTVEVFTCDVTDYDAVETTLKGIECSMPRIAGVCHGAMVLQDALFQDVNMAQVEKVLKPKVDGAINLDKAFCGRSLEFFILLSSIAAITGNAGQSIYAAANGYLAGLAAGRRVRGEPASTINLGPILGAGALHALTTDQQTKLEKEGVMWTSEDDFHTAFAEAVVASPSGSGSSGEFTTGVRVRDFSEQFKPKYASNPIFSHMLSRDNVTGQPSSTIPRAESVRAQLLYAASEYAVFQILEDFLTTKLLRALHMPQDSTVIDKTAEALGIDSLIAVEMRSWLLKELGVDLPLLMIIGGDIMRKVLESCRARIDPQMVPLLQMGGSLPSSSDARHEVANTEAEASTGGQAPLANTHEQPDTATVISRIESADNDDAEFTKMTTTALSAPTLEHISDGEAVPIDAKPDTESIPLVHKTPSEQDPSQHQSMNGHDAPYRAASDNSSRDDTDSGIPWQRSGIKGGAVAIHDVSHGSPSGSSKLQSTNKSRKFFGRLLRSRRFASLRKYL